MLKRQDKMEGNLSRQIEKLQAATEARIDKGEKDLEKLENRFNDFVRDIPRNYVDYIVTEYGVARMKGRSVMERTMQLINIAHPDVRDELRFYAKQQFYI